MEQFFTSLSKRQTMLLLTSLSFNSSEAVSAYEHLPVDEEELLRHRALALLEVPKERRIPMLVGEIKRLVTQRRRQLGSADPQRLAAVLRNERPAMTEVVLRALPVDLAEAVRVELGNPVRIAPVREVKPEVLSVIRWKLEEALRQGGPQIGGFRFTDLLTLQQRELLAVADRMGARVLATAVAGLPEAERQELFGKLPPDQRALAQRAAEAGVSRRLSERDARLVLEMHGAIENPSAGMRSAGMQRVARACLAQSPEFAQRLIERLRGDLGRLLHRWVREERPKAVKGDGGRLDIVEQLERLAQKGILDRPMRLQPPMRRQPAVAAPPAGPLPPPLPAPPRPRAKLPPANDAPVGDRRLARGASEPVSAARLADRGTPSSKEGGEVVSQPGRADRGARSPELAARPLREPPGRPERGASFSRASEPAPRNAREPQDVSPRPHRPSEPGEKALPESPRPRGSEPPALPEPSREDGAGRRDRGARGDDSTERVARPTTSPGGHQRSTSQERGHQASADPEGEGQLPPEERPTDAAGLVGRSLQPLPSKRSPERVSSAPAPQVASSVAPRPPTISLPARRQALRADSGVSSRSPESGRVLRDGKPLDWKVGDPGDTVPPSVKVGPVQEIPKRRERSGSGRSPVVKGRGPTGGSR